MWRCKKCETWNEDYYDSCSICHQEKEPQKIKPTVETSSGSFYDNWEQKKDTDTSFNPANKQKNILKILVVTVIVLLAVFGLLFIVLLIMNLGASAVAFRFENQMQGGVEYVLQPMREILAGWQQ